MNRKLYFVGFIIFIYAYFFQISPCHAINPYDNWALPGSYFSLYPVYYTASKLKNNKGKTLLINIDARVYETVLKFTTYNKSFLPNTLGFTLLLHAGRKDLRGEHDLGIGDLTVGLGYWFIDDPVSKTYFVLGSFLDIPTGDYNKNRIVNMGENVWKIRPVLGMAKQLGKFNIETALFYNIFTENNDTNTKEGNETILEVYVGYMIYPGLLAGGNFNATFGVNKTVNGHKIHDSGIRRFQVGPSIYWNTGNRLCITLSALSEFGVRNTSQGYLFTGRFAWGF
ncbi:MAG: transporter [Pseudomonadota bacterium]